MRTSFATATGTGAWREMILTSVAAPGATSLSLEVVVSLGRGTTRRSTTSLKPA